MARVMLFGGRGYLGEHFHRIYPDAIVPVADISDRNAVASLLEKHRPDVVINCAGKTGRPNVDWCETHQSETLRANVTGVLVLLEECLNRGLYLVHLGSGCIYTGDNQGHGWAEDAPANFTGSFYSRTKAWSDHILQSFPVLNLRLRMPFDDTTNERNLIMKLRKYRRVLTERNSLTCLPDLMRVAKTLIERRAVGTFNVVNPGAISPFEVMMHYRQIVDATHWFEPLPLEQMGEVAQTGRSNCLLNGNKLRAAGLTLPPVEEAVMGCLRRLAGQLTLANTA